MDMQRGMRERLDRHLNLSLPVEINLAVTGGPAQFACFAVDSQRNFADPGYMVRSDRWSSARGEITYFGGPGRATFTVDLSVLPRSVDRLVLTASLPQGQVMGAMQSVTASLGQLDADPLVLALGGQQFKNENAVIMLEVYRKDGWRVAAVARGFAGGEDELMRSFGCQPIPRSQEPAAQPQAQQGAPAKVELRKGQKVNLSKSGGGQLGEVLINLNWSQPAPKRGIFGSWKTDAIDLDLGCLYEMKDGSKGCVQALGNSFGSLATRPYIALDGDDRSGASAAGENLRVNGAKAEEFRRILVYTFIYEGAANWTDADGVVTVRCPGCPEIVVRMDEYGSRDPMCAIAMLENDGGNMFSVEKLVRFFNGHVDMDRAYSWNMRWVPGRKD